MKTQSFTNVPLSAPPPRVPLCLRCLSLATLALVFLTASLLAAGAVTQTNLIVRLYYGDRSKLNQLVEQYDIFEFADHNAGYVDARLSPTEYDELTQSGYRVEVDAALTAQANTPLALAADQATGIPSYLCYRTVEETYATLSQIATNYPGLASLVDIGDSWEKVTPGGSEGYDLLVLILSNKSRPGPKPRLFLVAEYHAREYTTAETALRFAEELVTGYGVNADVTWLLDYYEIHILPMANPDGRKWAEQGQLWRKNTDNNDGCSTFPNYGTDLNRNLSFKWGFPGSSASACYETYRGPSALSEPENVAISSYILSLFPDQRGPNDTDAAPESATGLVINLHSYSPLIIYPWGWTTAIVPNSTALRTLGGRFSYFSRYTVQQAIDLYAVSGELDDWVYGELGVAVYTFEMGTAFFQSCTSFENTIYPSNRPALHYAAKACRQPYLDPAGPDVLQPTLVNSSGPLLTLNALAASGRSFGYSPLPAAPNITAARYTVDRPSWTTGVVAYAMTALDGSYNSTNETVTATIDTTGWSPGRHTLFVEARTGTTNWGVPTAIFTTIAPPILTASLQPGGLQLRWPSVTNRFYTLLQATNPAATFNLLANNLPAQPPTNTYTDPINPTGARFYRLQLQP
jgi:carboxypeptidase T